MTKEDKKEMFNYVRSIVEVIAVVYAAFVVVSTVGQLKVDVERVKEVVTNHESRISVLEALRGK